MIYLLWVQEIIYYDTYRYFSYYYRFLFLLLFLFVLSVGSVAKHVFQSHVSVHPPHPLCNSPPPHHSPHFCHLKILRFAALCFWLIPCEICEKYSMRTNPRSLLDSCSAEAFAVEEKKPLQGHTAIHRQRERDNKT